jgi:hypothetical protein
MGRKVNQKQESIEIGRGVDQRPKSIEIGLWGVNKKKNPQKWEGEWIKNKAFIRMGR